MAQHELCGSCLFQEGRLTRIRGPFINMTAKSYAEDCLVCRIGRTNMKLLLTSFGINERLKEPLENWALYYKMPPADMRTISNVFLPDWTVLLLCEKIILDEASFAALEKPCQLYSAIAETLKALYDEGFVELVDFKGVLRGHGALLATMLEHDLDMLDHWVAPLRESLDIWCGFTRTLESELSEASLEMRQAVHLVRQFSGNWTYALDEALKSSRKRRKAEYRSVLRETLYSYLSYINANIVLSNELGVGFHDWADFLPFYRQKFLSVGYEDLEAQKQIEASKGLFTVSFPEFAITDTATLIRVLNDKRIVDLRQLVQDSVDGKVSFDEGFAKRVLKEVLTVEREAARYRTIISYLTIPLDLVPYVGTFVQKAVEEAAGMMVEKRLKRGYRWFYMLSDAVEKSRMNEKNRIC